MKIKKLGIVAGSGNLPQKAVNEAILQNLEFYVYALSEEDISPVYDKFNNKIEYEAISMGRFDEAIKKLKKDGVSHLLVVGKIHKNRLLKGIRFNLQTLALLKKIRDNNDKSIFNLVAAEFKTAGIVVLRQDQFLKNLLLPSGVYSKKKPSKEESDDIVFGMNFAKKIAALDIGQCVVVARKTLLAVEAIEGTDATILRAGSFSYKKDAVVCKAIRKNQDTRFDVPSVGPHTLDVMHESGCKILAIEADRTFVIDQEEFIKKVNRYKMVFVSVKP